MVEIKDFIDFMKDVIDVVIRIMAWILLISVVIICIYEIPNISAWDDINNTYTCTTNNFYINQDSCANDAEILNDFVETLPPVFINEFRQNWKVVIKDSIYIQIDSNNNIIGGYTDWNSRTVFVKKQTNSIDTLNIFVHELGHCFDLEYGSVSYSDFFRSIYNLYKDDFSEQYTNSPVGYPTSSEVEFFATCFKEYMLYPEHLKTVAPKAYDFVDYFYKNIQKIKYIYIYDFGAIANTISRLTE